jgi:hypothetical protein
MGEVAEMLLDGTMCETCGEFIGDAVGYPRSCCDKTHCNYLAEMEDCDDDDDEDQIDLDDIDIQAKLLLFVIEKAKSQGLVLSKTQQTFINSTEKLLNEFLESEIK